MTNYTCMSTFFDIWTNINIDDHNCRFGGTDGEFHYNDTWCYDTSTGTWSDLTCIGFVPLPREGHAAALVDDVMYVFGGRGVDGKDLGDLAAFKISSELTLSSFSPYTLRWDRSEMVYVPKHGSRT